MADPSPPLYGNNPIAYAVAIGLQSLQVIGINPNRRKLIIHNPNVTAKIAVCPALDNNNNKLVAAMNTQGSVVILPLDTLILDDRPVQAFNAISDTNGVAITLWEIV